MKEYVKKEWREIMNQKNYITLISCILFLFFFTGTFIYPDHPTPTPEMTPTIAMYGDVNMDNKIDIIDALLIAQYYVGLDPEELKNLAVADVNNDGKIDIVDALLVAQFYVGVVPGFISGTQ
jgi:spore coat protein CotH